jgi:hypothetical protein
MHTHSSITQEFLNAHDVIFTAEPDAGGVTADWFVEMPDCRVLIEEKTSAHPLRRETLDRAANQLDAMPAEYTGAFRVLWHTRCFDGTREGDDRGDLDAVTAESEFFQRNPGIDGVVVAHKNDLSMHARLSVNPHSQQSPRLAKSSFATRLKYARYLPIEFPNDIVPGVVSGAQPKLLLQRKADGKYSSSRRSPTQLKERMDAAADIVTQLGAYFLRKKSEHPDWADEHNLERIRRGLQAKAIDGKWPFTLSEQRWIMARLREFVAVA